MVTLWKQHSHFSPEFLAQHHEIVLWEFWHQINALLLYPPNCGCNHRCLCENFREKITLSLNLELLHKAQAEGADQATLSAMHWIFNIPPDRYFKQRYTEAYPIWLINENFQKKEEEHHFQIVSRLVWTLLRLGKTHQQSWLREPSASINEAIEVILGNTPLKTKNKSLQNDGYLCGEKGYTKQFNAYKPICHFIAAYEYLKEQEGHDLFFMATRERIERFLSLSQWFRQELLLLQTPNVKGNILFSKEMLLSLPAWVSTEEIDISIEPFEDLLFQMEEAIKNAPSYRSTKEHRMKRA
jgi:hypothetical protein